MCVDGVGHLVMADERVQTLMADPRLDFVHQQVVMTLYALDAQGRLEDYREILPIYLSREWAECSEILDTIGSVGLLNHTQDGIELAYPITAEDSGHSCGCHA